MKSIVLGSVLVLSMLLVIPQQVGAYDFQNWRTWDTISQGSSGGFVGAAQINLHSSGIQSATGPIDGIFGAGTNSGVRIYQDAEGLGVDGIVGPNTWVIWRHTHLLASITECMIILEVQYILVIIAYMVAVIAESM
ncbi:peptidoglycan-binding protein [Geomicrobium sp. JCM 19039]|uniref:peptidoglycan-binding domain-containing protein n=1 Tax=Geomicrobium sp. JCM 19039 TaxID=1460636 RepID=UPI0005A64155|nr:peptidoglycan-binding domain-containing protein [Geomicrobium sp. JCM 19039]